MKKSHADTILHSITTGNLRMRSIWSVRLERMGTGGAAAAVVAFMTFIGGTVSFWLAVNRDLIGSYYGFYGLASLAESFPYLPVLLFAVCFAILTALLRKYDFSYKRPILGILALILVAVAAASYAIAREPLSGPVIRRGAGYMGMMRMQGANFILGTVTRVDGRVLYVASGDGPVTAVETTADTHYPFGTPAPGDTVRAVGSVRDGVFTAVGVRVFADGEPANGGMHRGNGMGRGMMLRTTP